MEIETVERKTTGDKPAYIDYRTGVPLFRYDSLKKKTTKQPLKIFPGSPGSFKAISTENKNFVVYGLSAIFFYFLLGLVSILFDNKDKKTDLPMEGIYLTILLIRILGGFSFAIFLTTLMFYNTSFIDTAISSSASVLKNTLANKKSTRSVLSMVYSLLLFVLFVYIYFWLTSCFVPNYNSDTLDAGVWNDKDFGYGVEGAGEFPKSRLYTKGNSGYGDINSYKSNYCPDKSFETMEKSSWNWQKYKNACKAFKKKKSTSNLNRRNKAYNDLNKEYGYESSKSGSYSCLLTSQKTWAYINDYSCS